MSVAVGAALKKIAVSLLTNPKVLKTVLGIILGIILIIVMPIIAVLGIFNGDIKFDTDELKQQIVANMTDEQKAELQFVEDTMLDIEDAMIAAGFPSKVKDAQVLYITSLNDKASEPDFVSKLVSCFAADQTDEQLIQKINSTFGVTLKADDFKKIMDNIRKTYVDTSQYTDIKTKNNLDLVIWAKNAFNSGWGYVYGTYGTVLNEKMLKSKMSQYPDEVAVYEEFIRQNWLGGRTADCAGLIKGYGWHNTKSGAIEIGSNGMLDVGANGMYNNATEKGSMNTMPDIPGLAVWMDGHIGIYIGNGEVIEAMNTKKGVQKTQLEGRGWSAWLKIPYINYKTEGGTNP